MALRKTLARRLTNAAKLFSSESLPPPPPPPRPAASLLQRLIPGSGAHEPGLLRRFLQRQPLFQSATPPPPGLALPVGDELADRIREMNATQIRLDSLLPPQSAGMRTEEARKVVRAARAEAATARLRETGRSCVSYAEFARVCREVAGGIEEGVGIGTALDKSGTVIVLGDVVFVRPEMLTKAIESMIPASMTAEGHQRREELKEMEAEKAEIDAKAEAQVRRELWGGLAFLALQTAGFMRLTFWELSWDVMEPICFYVTSLYFMGGYAFFLRTSRDPSFEGFFESRVDARRRRLMKARDFDVGRFNELRRDGGFSLSLLSEESCQRHGRRNTLVCSSAY